jgi:hypothetical protein
MEAVCKRNDGKGGEGRRGAMEFTATMGLAEFDVLWQGESDAWWSECGFRRKNVPRGIKRMVAGVY